MESSLFILFFVIVVTRNSTYSSDSRLMWSIFSAQCKARCLAEQRASQEFACFKPCREVHFYSVKSCRTFCGTSLTPDNITCRSSCKFLKSLYDTGKKSGVCGVASRSSIACTTCRMDSNCAGLAKCCQHSICGNICQQPLFTQPGLPSSPLSVVSTLTRKPKSIVLKWRYNMTSGLPVMFIVEVRSSASQIQQPQELQMGQWRLFEQTRLKVLRVKQPGSAVWTQFRVLAVNMTGTGDFSLPSTMVYAPPDRPSMPRDFRVTGMNIVKGKARVELAWKKPEHSDLPVHRYRLFWSGRLDAHTEKYLSLIVHHAKIRSNRHTYILDGLKPNTTYVTELQAICHFSGRRLRSRRVYLRFRTIKASGKLTLRVSKPTRLSYPRTINTGGIPNMMTNDSPNNGGNRNVQTNDSPNNGTRNVTGMQLSSPQSLTRVSLVLLWSLVTVTTCLS